MLIKTNCLYNNQKIIVTIITPVYNRASIIQRTFESVISQTYKFFEYIIIDDGSTDNIDDAVFALFHDKRVDFPITYIKKDNGGVHTARNVGFSLARGELLVNIDSDDELKSNALKTLVKYWEHLPNKEEYREVVCQCEDENGNRCGSKFPSNINSLKHHKAIVACRNTHGEHFAIMKTSVLKENLFPEPNGVTFLTENILWTKLENMGYRSFYVNDIFRIYHTEGQCHLSTVKKKNKQDIINRYWQSAYFLNNWKWYRYGLKAKVKTIIIYSIMGIILNDSYEKIHLAGVPNKLLYNALFIPSFLLAKIYRKKKTII